MRKHSYNSVDQTPTEFDDTHRVWGTFSRRRTRQGGAAYWKPVQRTHRSLKHASSGFFLPFVRGLWTLLAPPACELETDSIASFSSLQQVFFRPVPDPDSTDGLCTSTSFLLIKSSQGSNSSSRSAANLPLRRSKRPVPPRSAGYVSPCLLTLPLLRLQITRITCG